MNNILKLATLARESGLENLLLDNDIVNESYETIESIDTINETILTGDISVLPVYKVCEQDELEDIEESEFDTINEFNLASLKDKLMIGIEDYKDKQNKKKKEFVKTVYNDMVLKAEKFAAKTTNLSKLNKLIKIQTKNLDLVKENMKNFKNASKEEQEKTINFYNRVNAMGKGKNHTADDVLKDLSNTISTYEKVINIYKKRTKELSVNESYYIDLDTLFTVSEVYDIDLENSINLIKRVNNINENTKISVVLKEGFTNCMTVEDFYNLHEVLSESSIDVVSNIQISIDDFITEANMLSGLMDKAKRKIKEMNVNQLEKSIKQIEDMNKKLQDNLNKFEKMSKDEQKKYITKEFAKDIVIYTGSFTASMAGYTIAPSAAALKPFLGYTVLGGSLISAWVPMIRLIAKANKGKPSFILTSKSYKRTIRNTINQNNALIKNCKYQLKESKK